MAKEKSREEQIFSRVAADNLAEARLELRQSKDFSYEGLKKLHDKTFTDNYKHGQEVSDKFAEYNQVRTAGQEHDVHFKNRDMPGLETSISAYSNMKESDVQRTAQAIEQCRPENMKDLSFDQKIDKLSTMYQEMDYTHSFADGNSRVNRAFTAEVARASGVEMDFSKVSERDMYVARDKSLVEMSVKHRGSELLKHAPDLYKEMRKSKDSLTNDYPNVNLKTAMKSAAKEMPQPEKKLSLEEKKQMVAERLAAKKLENQAKGIGVAKPEQKPEQIKLSVPKMEKSKDGPER